MPEGHSIRHFANVHSRAFKDTKVSVSSPQGRFASEAEALNNATFLEPETHGKHLFFRFDDKIVHVHLGLYGWFTLSKDKESETRSTARLRIENDKYSSELIAPTKCELIYDIETITGKLGQDPLHAHAEPDKAWDKIRKSPKNVASLLMDQSVIAGIGNVYRAEILYRCQVNPFLQGKQLSKDKFDEIWDDAVYLLKIGATDGRIRTVNSGLLSEEELPMAGHGQFTYAYKRTGKPCRICNETIQQTDVNGRTLYWCPLCQQ